MMRWLVAAVGTVAFAGAAQAGSRLADLVQAGEDAAALKMIDGGANVNVPQGDGTTALDWATYRLDVPLVQALLEHGANPNLANSLGSCPLDEAVKAANFELAKMLLKAGAYADEANADGQTPLMLAAHIGSVKLAELLVSYGAKVNTRERWRGQTALMWAAALDHPDMVAFLVKHGANVNAREYDNDWLDRATQMTSEPRAQYRPEGGLTPLLYAVRSACLECVRVLLKAGADVNATSPEGVTPLISAIDNRHYDVAKYLLEHGANPKAWDWYGRTPLYVAVDMRSFNRFRGLLPTRAELARSTARNLKDGGAALDIIRMLLKDGADVNAQLDLHRPQRGADSLRFEDNLLREGATPLLRAAMSHDNVVVKMLLEHGALVDLPNVQGVTPLIAAAGIGFQGPQETPVPDHRGDYAPGAQARAIGTLAILLKAGANVNARVTDTTSYLARIGRNDGMHERTGQTALYGAIDWRWPRVVQYLLQHGARVDIQDDMGRTPLTAAIHGSGFRGFKPDKAIIAMIRKAAAEQGAASRASAATIAPSARAVSLTAAR